MPDRGVAYENFKKASMQDSLSVSLSVRHSSLQGAMLRLWMAATWPCGAWCCLGCIGGMQDGPAETAGLSCCRTKRPTGKHAASRQEQWRCPGIDGEAVNPCSKTLAVA